MPLEGARAAVAVAADHVVGRALLTSGLSAISFSASAISASMRAISAAFSSGVYGPGRSRPHISSRSIRRNLARYISSRRLCHGLKSIIGQILPARPTAMAVDGAPVNAGAVPQRGALVRFLRWARPPTSFGARASRSSGGKIARARSSYELPARHQYRLGSSGPIPASSPVRSSLVSSISQCNTSCSLLAGVSKAKVFRGR
jgi:hypothetical protein